MTKFFKIAFVFALVIPFANLAHADDTLLGLDLPSDFEPIDIPNEKMPLSENDLFLGLDLPTDFAAPIAENPEPAPTATPKTATPTIATTSGSGGKVIANSTPTISTSTPTAQNFVAPTPSSYFNSQIVSATLLDSNFEYSTHSSAELSETGPAATTAFAFFAAVGIAFFIRKKFARV